MTEKANIEKLFQRMMFYQNFPVPYLFQS